MAIKFKLLLTLSILLCFIFLITTPSHAKPDEDDEDLTFLQENDVASSDDDHETSHEHGEEQSEVEVEEPVEVDEKDVVVLKESNFVDFVKKNKYVMVEFYAPWCGHCKNLAPEYAAAATELKSDAVVLAKVDVTAEKELATKYDVEQLPTLYFFVDGVHKPYSSDRTKDAIVAWVKKKTGPRLFNITTIEDGKKILAEGKPVVLGYLNALVGSESSELESATKLEDDVIFYQTINADVAKLFHIDPEVKRPALVIVKKEAEKISYFGGGEFTKSALSEFVIANKFPLVIIFSPETTSQIFENSIKKQILLFATSKDSEKFLPVFQEAAKDFKGRVIYIYVDLDNREVGKPVSEYFGVSAEAPTVLACTGDDDEKKFILDGEISLTNLKTFGENFLEDNLKPFYKSDPIPEKNDGDIKIVVGNSFDEIVLDESKDVLLEIYAPWCGVCQEFEPIYTKLGEHLSGIDSLVVAKMDGAKNDHPMAKAEAFPTILFFPAGNKSSEPITVEGDRTLVELYKFLKKHVSIPFKLQKSADKIEALDGSNLKDEL